LAAEFDFHPEACWPASGNQKDHAAYCTSFNRSVCKSRAWRLANRNPVRGSGPDLTSIIECLVWRRIRRCVRSRIGHDPDATRQTFANVEAVRVLAVVPVEAVPIRTVARTSGWATAAARFATADVLLTVDDAIGAAVSPTQVGATSFCQSHGVLPGNHYIRGMRFLARPNLWAYLRGRRWCSEYK
jgi:hypothetical protein